MFPILTYAIKFYQNENDIIIKVESSQSTYYIGNLRRIKNDLEKSIAQIFCGYLGKKVKVDENNNAINFTPDKQFRWIDRNVLLFEEKNCNMIKEFNNNFDYTTLPKQQEYKEVMKIIVEDNTHKNIHPLDDINKISTN